MERSSCASKRAFRIGVLCAILTPVAKVMAKRLKHIQNDPNKEHVTINSRLCADLPTHGISAPSTCNLTAQHHLSRIPLHQIYTFFIVITTPTAAKSAHFSLQCRQTAILFGTNHVTKAPLSAQLSYSECRVIDYNATPVRVYQKFFFGGSYSAAAHFWERSWYYSSKRPSSGTEEDVSTMSTDWPGSQSIAGLPNLPPTKDVVVNGVIVKTTYENFRCRYDSKRNPYNHGCIRNVFEIFLSNIPKSKSNFRAMVRVESSPLFGSSMSLARPMITERPRRSFDIKMGKRQAVAAEVFEEIRNRIDNVSGLERCGTQPRHTIQSDKSDWDISPNITVLAADFATDYSFMDRENDLFVFVRKEGCGFLEAFINGSGVKSIRNQITIPSFSFKQVATEQGRSNATLKFQIN
ncbi:hypothetical protein F3Y22_tig00116944pilonHSYRG00042 [Hibiscus syriacus]|uniref:Uncharacterized protein n=1 Tax=Hibiscus syriacus TaxID=106335 RepID=A0A6A2WLU3_HIBSY|nr:hypothetical protein F3Y22_tig00116944pilonHSYRG00042 [Hibiscus syriacus]